MLEAEPYQLRHMAQRCQEGAVLLRQKADRLENQAQSLVRGSDGWTGQAAEQYIKRAELLQRELRKQSEVLHDMASPLHTLAHRIDMIHQKKHALANLKHRRSSMHWSLNPAQDAEIVHLDSRIIALEAEIMADSLNADMAAAASFAELHLSETFHAAWEEIQKAGSYVAHEAEASWKNYIKPALDKFVDGVLDFLDVPEIMAAWDKLFAPNSTLRERIHAASTILLDVGLDVSMLLGVGDVAKGVKFLAKFGAKYGEKILAAEGRKEVAAALSKGLGEYAEKVAGGADSFFNRGMLAADGVGVVGGAGATTAATLAGGFALAKASGTVYKFSGVISGKDAEELLQSKKTVSGRQELPDHIVPGEYKLKPNTTYSSNGYQYETDHLGRIKNAEGELRIDCGTRNITHQQRVGLDDRLPTDHGGHLIAHQFGGSGLIDNLVPMNGRLVNQSAFKKLENEWKVALSEGKDVYVKVEPVYHGEALRPTRFDIQYRIDGEEFYKIVKNP